MTGPQRWFWGWMFTPYLYAWQDPANVSATSSSIRTGTSRSTAKPTSPHSNTISACASSRPNDDLNYGYGEQLSVYQQGNAGGSITYSGFIGSHYEDPALPIAGKNVTLHTPIGPSGRTDPFFGSWGLSVSVDSKAKEAAWFLIQWITHKNQLTKAATGGLPAVRHSTFQNAEVQSAQPWVAELYDYMVTTANPDERIRVPEWAEISEIMGLYGNRAWGNEISAEEALAGDGKGHEGRLPPRRLLPRRRKQPQAALA